MFITYASSANVSGWDKRGFPDSCMFGEQGVALAKTEALNLFASVPGVREEG